jgi:hypothetical protein
MTRARATTLVALLVGCGPEHSTDSEASTTTTATTGDPSADDGSAGTVDAGPLDMGTGDPPCVPWTGAALGWERDGDDVLPRTGGVARVAVAPDGAISVAVTDTTEDDEDVVVMQLDVDGNEAWSLRYEGMAGLTDEPLDIAVADDGSIYVVVREQTLELVSEGFGSRYEWTLVVLAIEPSGERRWRYERVISPDYDAPVRTAGIDVAVDGHPIVVEGAPEVNLPPHLLELDRFGNAITSVDLDAGSFAQHIDVDVSATDAVYALAVGYEGSWIGRVQRDGAVAWADESDPGNVVAMSVAAGADDEAYVLARIGDDETGDSGFELRRYDADGTIAWRFEQEWSTGAGAPAAVVVDCDGAPLVVGEEQGQSDRDAWIGRISPSGALAWSTTLTSVRAIAPRSVALLGEMLVLGGLEGGDELGPWVARLQRE